MSKRKYAVGDWVVIKDKYRRGDPYFAQIVRINGRGYNVKEREGDEHLEHYRTAKEIVRKLSKLEKALK